ncbi:MAG TPA: amino acid ABC transporter permease [Aliidongia sp.]|nr:amino acid ABC transporter permease [Aliidongia sp.]
MDPVAAWFRWLDDAHGINFTVAYDAFDRARFLRGLLMTIELSVSSIVLSLIIGAVGAGMARARNPILRGCVYWIVQFFRNTPPLAQLYFFFFGLNSVLVTHGANGLPQPLVGNVAWAILSLSLFAGAHNVELFRAGIEAVPATMLEAAESLGYSRFGTYRHIILPLAFRISLPAVNNNLVNLVKTTSVAYAIAVPEMLYVSNQIWSDSLNVPEMMLLLLVCYLALVGILVRFMGWWERALRVPGFGA